MRKPVSKKRSVKKFRREVGKAKLINIAPPPTRGGYRL